MFKKGDPKHPASGKAKGTPNGDTAKLREMIVGALDAVGGQEYLAKQAIEQPVAFLTLIGKCLPKDIALASDSKIVLTVITGVNE